MNYTVPKNFADVTPSDTAPVNATLGLYVGGGGIVKAAGVNGVVVTFLAQSGQYLIGNFAMVMATGTTATSIVALYA